MEYIIIGSVIIAGLILVIWLKFYKKPFNNVEVTHTSDKELVKEEKKDTLLSRAKDKTSSISKKDRYRIKGYRDNAISRKYDKLFPLSERPFQRFGSFEIIESKWYWPRKGGVK